MRRYVSQFVLLAMVMALMSTRLPSQASKQPSTDNRYALLIGIDTYRPAGAKVTRPANTPATGRFAVGMVFDNLQGPKYDIQNMRALLTSEKFGFPDDEQHIHVLLDEKATRQAILDALNQYIAGAKSGDTVVLYISSHGSLRINDAGNGSVYKLGGEPHKLDSTIVPADAYLGAEDVSSGELRDVLLKAAKNGVHVTVIIDACHSGGQARGATGTMVKRSLSWDPRDLNQPPPPGKAPEDLDDNPVLVMSASQKDQSAMDVQNSTPPHGLFTDALVTTLKALPAGAKATDVFRRVMVEIEVEGVMDQQPALDSTAKRKAQPLFGGAAEQGPPRATVVSVDEQGAVLLDIGALADIGVKSQFMDARGTILEVKSTQGIDRLLAAVKSPPGAKVKATDIVTLKTWYPADRPKLYLYEGPLNLSLTQVNVALKAVRDSKLTLVADPSSDMWTHLLLWDGTGWVLRQRNAAGSGASLGASLTVASLQNSVPTGSIVWLDAPLPTEFGTIAGLKADTSAARITTNRTEAMYLIASRLTENGLEFAWYKQSDFNGDLQTPKGLGTGCSPSSAFPLRTEWAALQSGVAASSGKDTMEALTEAGIKLAKLNGWLTLQSTSVEATPFSYTLAMQRLSDKKMAADGGATYGNERYGMMLTNDGSRYVGLPRWVYVLGIDCQGNGQLMWPREGPGGKFPTDHGLMDTIPLPGVSLRITPPFGTDSYILLTTSTQLADPSILEFEGVVRSGSTRERTPLEMLLQSASSGTRGNALETPTDWGIQLLQMHSRPTAEQETEGKNP
jgi:hypothetical protein